LAVQRAAGERFLAKIELPRPLQAAMNIDVGRDFFDVAVIAYVRPLYWRVIVKFR